MTRPESDTEWLAEIRAAALARGIDLSYLTDEEIERKIAIAEIRERLAALGFPIDHLTDDEVEQRVIDFSRAMAETGIISEEAASDLTGMAILFKETENNQPRMGGKHMEPVKFVAGWLGFMVGKFVSPVSYMIGQQEPIEAEIDKEAGGQNARFVEGARNIVLYPDLYPDVRATLVSETGAPMQAKVLAFSTENPCRITFKMDENMLWVEQLKRQEDEA